MAIALLLQCLTCASNLSRWSSHSPSQRTLVFGLSTGPPETWEGSGGTTAPGVTTKYSVLLTATGQCRDSSFCIVLETLAASCVLTAAGVFALCLTRISSTYLKQSSGEPWGRPLAHFRWLRKDRVHRASANPRFSSCLTSRSSRQTPV